MKNEQEIWVPCPEQQILKGASDKYEYRLSDRGILEAEETALRLLKYYMEQGKSNLMLLHSDLNRTTEFDEILRRILRKGTLEGEVIHKAVPEFRERFFGSIEGQPKNKLEKAVDKIGIAPNLGQALTYLNDFTPLAEFLGLNEQEPGEPFLDTFKRLNTGVHNYIVEECLDENKVPKFDYVPIAAHQISGLYLLAALKLITRPPKLVEGIIRKIERQKNPETLQMYKECLVPHYDLEPSRFNRIRFTHYNDRLWFTGIEQNDRGHLVELEAKIIDPKTKQLRIEEEEAERVKRVRNSLSRWYAQRGWPVDPDKTVFPFETYNKRNRRGPDIGSPLELYYIIMDKKKLDDQYISNHMGTRKNIEHFPDWIEKNFGYCDLAELIKGKLTQLTVTPPNLKRVRSEIHTILKNYMSSN